MEYYTSIPRDPLLVLAAVLSGIGVVLAMIAVMLRVELVDRTIIRCVAAAAVTAFAIGGGLYADSGNEDDYEKVIVDLLPYSDSREEPVRQGKRTVLVNRLYLYYQTPHGIVSFRREAGIVYPEKAILYRKKLKG